MPPTHDATVLAPLPGLPTRHGADVTKARRVARHLRWLIRGANPEPTAAQWRAQAHTLLRGDEAADRLVNWMQTVGVQVGMPQFERALAQGIEAMPDAPPELRAFFAAVEATPAWVDPELLRQGAAACHISGLSGMRVLRNAALMAGYQASAINRTLVLTGALAKGAQRRVAETTKWWIDVTREGGLGRFAPGFQTTLRVRVIHAMLRKRVHAMPEWDEAALGLPINQGDMRATYLGFSVIFLLGQRVMGVKITDAEAHAVMHLWRHIGWLMGVEEGLLCETELEGRVALYQNLLAQAPADESSRALGRALMDEPLLRHYTVLPRLAGRLEKARQLSICRMFLGPEGMRDLGLPSHVMPWYPMLTVPFEAAYHRLNRLLPGGRQRLIRQGHQAQMDYLKVMFGHARPDITEIPAPH